MNGRERREYWLEQVRLAERAGGSLAEFARAIEAPPHKLYYWCRAVRRRGAGIAAPAAKAVVPKFAEVRVAAASERVTCGDGTLRLLMPDGAQRQWSSSPNR